jgi:hypothetical protein
VWHQNFENNKISWNFQPACWRNRLPPLPRTGDCARAGSETPSRGPTGGPAKERLLLWILYLAGEVALLGPLSGSLPEGGGEVLVRDEAGRPAPDASRAAGGSTSSGTRGATWSPHVGSIPRMPKRARSGASDMMPRTGSGKSWIPRGGSGPRLAPPPGSARIGETRI